MIIVYVVITKWLVIFVLLVFQVLRTWLSPPLATISASVASQVPRGSCSYGSLDSVRVQSNIENFMDYAHKITYRKRKKENSDY